MSENVITLMQTRFRGYLPVIVDVETGGLNAEKDALLEVAAVAVDFDANQKLILTEEWHAHISPFAGANLEKAALEFNGIDPTHPFRFAVSEGEALTNLFSFVKKHIKKTQCKRAFLVGHNAWFDLSFIRAAVQREKLKAMPFHQFTALDTASLAGLALGQTVLRKALEAANLPYLPKEAHSALYDARCTAELFCYIVNTWNEKAGWPLPKTP